MKKIICALVLTSSSAFATADAQKEHEQAMAEAAKTAAMVQREHDAEALRDKSHDGRVKVGEGVSVGGAVQEGGGSVNIKIDTDPPKH